MYHISQAQQDFLTILYATYPSTQTLLIAGVALPNIVRMAATECFMVGDCRSPGADAIRNELFSLENRGAFSWHKVVR